MNNQSLPKANARVLTTFQLMCFGLLTTPLAMSGIALVMFVPTFYAVDMGLGLAGVGAVFMFGRIFDVVTDPLIGRISDETRSKFGPRLPFMLVGVPLFCVSVYLLLSPPEGAGLVYLTIVSAAFFLTYTIVDVPYSSIGLEISPDTHERTFLASSKAVFQVIGAIAAGALPFALSLAIPDALSQLGWIIVILSGIGLAAFIMFVPRRNRDVASERTGLVASVRKGFSNADYRWLIVAFFIVQSANALTAGLLVLFVTHVIEAPAMIGAYTGLMFLSSALFLPLWIFVSKRWSKKAAWMAGIVTCIVALGFVTTLGAGSTLAFGFAVVLIGATFGTDAVMPTSLLADIIGQDEQAGGSRFAGTFLAIKNAVSKLTFVWPMGLAFPVLDWAGFDRAGQNGAEQIGIFMILTCALPITLRLIALVVLWRGPASRLPHVNVVAGG